MGDDGGGTGALHPGGWLRSEDPAGLPQRMARLLAVLESSTGAPCVGCRRTVCGHDVVIGVVTGHEGEPWCLACLADDVGRDVESLRATVLPFVRSKECLRRAWGIADAMPHRGAGCEAGAATAGDAEDAVAAAAADDAVRPPDEDSAWDAGDMGCGDLVLELRMRLRALSPGAVLRVTARDPGAPEDLPAWCRITGNPLLRARHPDYWVRRKD